MEVIAEGRTLHRPTQQVYYYRLDSDSTILIRRERPPGGADLRIPATTLTFLFHRTEEHLLGPERDGEYLGIGFENQTLVLRVSQRFDLYVLGTLVLMVLLGGPLLLWLWWRLAAERRRRKALAQSRHYLTKGREKERERLAREIHDGPVQDLHGLHMQLKALTDPSDDMREMGDELMRVTGELRALSADLHPPALQRFGLAAALRSHVDRLRDRHPDLRLDTDLPDDCGPLSEARALALFRVAQEALNNAVQHGHADRVRLRLRCPDDTIELVIRDDGDGFSPPSDWHALAEEDHYGLLGMRERAEAIDATFDIDSAPGDGTRVRLRSEREAPDSSSEPVAA
jgi:signal transduction histidine kinase